MSKVVRLETEEEPAMFFDLEQEKSLWDSSTENNHFADVSKMV
jgi:hypothetical protein